MKSRTNDELLKMIYTEKDRRMTSNSELNNRLFHAEQKLSKLETVLAAVIAEMAEGMEEKPPDLREMATKTGAMTDALFALPFDQWPGWITYLLEILEVALESGQVPHNCANSEIARRRFLQNVVADIETRLEEGEW